MAEQGGKTNQSLIFRFREAGKTHRSRGAFLLPKSRTRETPTTSIISE
jgi:hypothetical protein